MDKINRGECVQDIITLANHFSITECQVLKLIAMAYGIPVRTGFNPNEIVSLIKKGLLKSFNVVNKEKLFGPLASLNLPEEDYENIKIETAPAPSISESGQKAIEKLFDLLVPEDERSDTYIKTYASKYFMGSIWAAKSFLVFRAMFPKGDIIADRLWNKAFGVIFSGKNRWAETSLIRAKFLTLYKTLDIGIFLLGTYFYVFNAIDQQSKVAYVSSVNNYLKDYEQWYEKAKKRIDSVSVNNNRDVDYTKKPKEDTLTGML